MKNHGKEICCALQKDSVELIKILSRKEHTAIYGTPEFSGIWLHSADYATELRLLILSDIQITVSRVCFSKRRQGTMTEVLKWIEKFAKTHGIGQIVIQSVVTNEMRCWCVKHGFSPNMNASFELEGEIYGDYVRKAF